MKATMEETVKKSPWPQGSDHINPWTLGAPAFSLGGRQFSGCLGPAQEHPPRQSLVPLPGHVVLKGRQDGSREKSYTGVAISLTLTRPREHEPEAFCQ